MNFFSGFFSITSARWIRGMKPWIRSVTDTETPPGWTARTVHYVHAITDTFRAHTHNVYTTTQDNILLLCPFNGLFPGQPCTRKVNHSGFYWSKRWWGGSGITWTICKSFAPHSRQITMPVPHHSVFTGRMPFLPPKQQRQSTKGTHHHHNHFTTLFLGPSGSAGARRELLDFMVQGKINRGRHTDHPAGHHSIRTNQCPPPPYPHLLQARCPSCHPTNSVKALKATRAFGLGRRR